MFSNCYKYNPPDHEVVAMARKLQVRVWGAAVAGEGGPGHCSSWVLVFCPPPEQSLNS